MDFQRLIDIFVNIKPIDCVLLVVSFVFLYCVFAFLKNNNAKVAVFLFALISIILSCSFLLEGGNGKLILILPALFLLIVCAIFSVEIKRAIWSTKTESKTHELKVSERQVDKSINEVIRAVQNMSKQNVGALIILADAAMPNSILESGTYLNAEITSQLIESVFFPKTPLHDGAMIVRGVNIVSAGCFLPLSQELSLPQELGTRHRAGIGITENIDVVSIIVSEESGIISIAQKGKIKRYIDNETLKHTLSEYYKNYYAKAKEMEK